MREMKPKSCARDDSTGIELLRKSQVEPSLGLGREVIKTLRIQEVQANAVTNVPVSSAHALKGLRSNPDNLAVQSCAMWISKMNL